MPQRCRICTRTNPDGARYCYHDGAMLSAGNGQAGPVAIGSQHFPSPFIFPSGRACRNFDELVLGCEADWDGARDMLRRGYLESFLAATGRADLAAAARQAAIDTDADRALDELLAKLPGDVREPPQLRAQPQAVNLGRLPRGEDRQFVLHIENQGMGLLSGAITVSGAPWILLGDGMGSPRKVFQCRGEVRLPVRINSRALRANDQPSEGKLVISSSGGNLVINVRVEVPVVPFPEGPLAGATSPRQLASKAKADPKKAAPYFERGLVAAWYEHNGWTYPVQGPSSSGLGAVQQFFEALGLVTPPKVDISERTVHLYGSPGAVIDHVLVVQAAEARPVFAHATTGVPWLRIGRIVLEGRTARVPLRIPEVPARPGELLTGKVLVQANGNQRFIVEVSLGILGSASKPRSVPAAAPTAAPTPAPPPAAASHPLPAYLASPPPQRQAPPSPKPTWPVAPPVVVVEAPATVRISPMEIEALLHPTEPPEPMEALPAEEEVVGPYPSTEVPQWPPAPSTTEEGRSASPVPLPLLMLPFGVLLLALLITLLHDLLLPPDSGDSLALVDSTPRIAVRFHDGPKELPDARPGDEDPMPEPTMRFGIVMLQAKDPLRPERNKRLTFDEWGRSNNTCLRIDHDDALFGERLGQWAPREVPLPPGSGSRKREGLASIWQHKASKVRVTQEVELVPGEQSRLLDTCLVRYTLENTDSKMHRVGLRFLLDTFIGANDGVPFTVPGAAGLCDSLRAFDTPTEVPDFIEALEHDNLSHPGTVAHLQLRLGGKIEAPSRVTLGGWPNQELQRFGFARADSQRTKWEVPLVGMHELENRTRRQGVPAEADSAVTMYWPERDLLAGEQRTVGFAYGLGTVSSSDSGGRLLLTLGGRLVKDGEFTLTALVANPLADERLTLNLPPGFTLVSGTADQAVPAVPVGAARATSPVTWRIRAGGDGRYELFVRSNKGPAQSVRVTIRTRGVFD